MADRERYPFIPLDFEHLSPDEQRRRLEEFSARMHRRRTVRDFSDRPVPEELVVDAVRVAGRAPSGANQQPWKFVLVGDPGIKRRIREAAEEEERISYGGRMPREWLDALAPLGTDANKPFLETVPWIIVVFKLEYGVGVDEAGNERKIKHYYVNESVGLASGFLLAALHLAGLATLTHTPSPMGFLCEILEVPKNHKPFLLIPVGYPAEDATVPKITKKPIEEILRIV